MDTEIGQSIRQQQNQVNPAESIHDLRDAVPDYSEVPVHLDLATLVGPDGSAQYNFTEDMIDQVSAYISAARLAPGAYIECSNPENNDVIIYTSKDIERLSAGGGWLTSPVKGEAFSIRLIYTSKLADRTNDTLVVERVRFIKSSGVRSILGEDERVEIACVENTLPEIFTRSRAIGQISAGGVGTGWLLGAGNFVLTNHHVAGDPGPFSGRMYFNYQYETCDATGNAQGNMVMIPTKSVLRSDSQGTDWALVTLDDLEYREAGIQQVFGGLKLQETQAAVGTQACVVGYGNGKPLRIGYMSDGVRSTITSSSAGVLGYNCDTAGGSSGSPVLDTESGVALGVHYAGGSKQNYAVTSSLVWPKIQDLAPDALEKEVVGTGKVRSASFEFSPFRKQVSQSFSGAGLTFDALHQGRLQHFPTYSLLRTVSRNQRGEETDFFIRLSITDASGTSNLLSPASNEAATGRTLNLWVAAWDNSTLKMGDTISGWAPVQVFQNGELLYNQINHFYCGMYDPYTPPFDPDTAVRGTLRRDQTLWFERPEINMGWVAVYKGEGPTSLVWRDTAESVLEVPIKTEDGEEVVVKLRASRYTACGLYSVNSCVVCSGGYPSWLKVRYLSEDNPTVPAGRYFGLLPLMGRDWHKGDIAIPYLIDLDIAIGQIPVADAGADQFVAATSNDASTYQLDGSKSLDPSGTGLTYQWKVLSGEFTLRNPTEAIAEVVVPKDTTGVTKFELTVTNGQGETTQATTRVVCVTPEVMLSGRDQLEHGSPVAFSAQANFSDETYTWKLFDASNKTVATGMGKTWETATTLEVGVYKVQVEAYSPSGDRQAMASQSLAVAAPVPVAKAGPDRVLVASYDYAWAYTLDASESEDPLGKGLTYQWSVDRPEEWLKDADNAKALAIVPVDRTGMVTYTLKVTDASGSVDSDSVNLTIALPAVTLAGPYDVPVNTSGRFAAQANFSNATYRWTLQDISGQTVAAGYGAAWETPANLVLGRYTLTLDADSHSGKRHASTSHQLQVHK
jgi:V8-like Glu-specific endopeptidase